MGDGSDYRPTRLEMLSRKLLSDVQSLIDADGSASMNLYAIMASCGTTWVNAKAAMMYVAKHYEGTGAYTVTYNRGGEILISRRSPEAPKEPMAAPARKPKQEPVLKKCPSCGFECETNAAMGLHVELKHPELLKVASP